MPIPRGQLRLTHEELDELMTSERTLRAATVGDDGSPHLAPLWFVWHDGAVWVNNLRRSRRSRHIGAGSKTALCVDTGHQYGELRGTVLYGSFAEATDDPRLDEVRRRFADKYWGGHFVPDIPSHVWISLTPERVVSWDFRKIPSGRDKRLDEAKQAGAS